ncbi:MAG TPA: hypothetical protein VFF52_00675 [Isosphaeraceae bacterium]|nr:hypothetical protein [Isosphaeraceae bacterium]
MARSARLWLTVAFLAGWPAGPAARAQTPAPQPAAATTAPATRTEIAELLDDVQNVPAPLPGPAATTPTEGWEPEFLKTLPQPLDQPRSLFQAPPPPGPPPPDLERYFEPDPTLDPARWGNPFGWFTNVQLDVIHPHLNFGQMRLISPPRAVPVHVGPGGPLSRSQLPTLRVTPPMLSQHVIIAPGAGQLPWTVAPRLEIGYRLPSGFGAFAFSDRFFMTEGIGPFAGPAGATTRTTRLGVNYSDWDYINREYTPWDNPRTNWSLQWRAGIRLAETWTAVRADQSFAEAAARGRAFIQGDSNYTVGAGPHFAVEVDRKDLPSGFSFIMRFDIADTFTRVRQLFEASTTTFIAPGVLQRGVYNQNFWNQVPILNYQVGVGWQPPQNPNIALYVGYVYEFWWQLASNMNYLNPYANQGATRGSLSDQGLVFRAQFKW